MGLTLTPELASELGKKGAAKRTENFNRRKAMMEELLKPNGLPPDVLIDLEIVEEQIARARTTLNDDTPYCEHCERGGLLASHQAQLLKALDSLLDRRRELLGRPRLATLKPTAKPQRRSQELPSPTPSEE